MKKHKLLSILLLFLVSSSLFSQGIWKKRQNKSNIILQELEYRASKPTSFELYTLDNLLITQKLKKSTIEQNIIELPTPLGLQRFKINEASVLSDELAAKHPSIKAYVGVGIDDPTARVRFSKSQVGLHAMITSGKYPMYLIDPYTKDKNTAIAYYKKNSLKSKFECLVEESVAPVRELQKTSNASDGKLRTYKLALIATGAYSQFHLTNQGVGAGETDATKKAAVLAALNTTMTRINGVFERDLSITMQLVSNNENLIFLDAGTDGLTDGDVSALLSESQVKCDAIIGDANYDIGHAFGKNSNAGGLAAFEVVCSTSEKAEGASVLDSPIGDGFDIDVVAHEMGHQFGANHTFNSSCNDNRNSATAIEVGSGTTIMAYAGWCAPNVQNNSDAFFHAVSIAEMWSFITSTTCAVETVTNNATPIANAGNNYTIPNSTPFVLKGSATDADTGNSLTYSWEQTDNAIATMPPVATSAVGPMFRSLSPSASADRYMPAIETVLAGSTSTTWEVVPSVARNMNFALTVRDNVVNGAATHRDNMVITVNGASGPFVVTSQTTSTTLQGNSTQTITWDVANTTAAPVSSANVNILLSTDGGLTYPHTLVSNTPNDGTEEVSLNNVTTSLARIMVEAADNIFYAVNTTNFSIDKVAGVDDEFFSDFNVYPNPTNGKITVSFVVVSSDDVIIKLFDIRGREVDQKVYQVSSSQFQKELNYQSIAKGLYILKVENGQHRISKKILID